MVFNEGDVQRRVVAEVVGDEATLADIPAGRGGYRLSIRGVNDPTLEVRLNIDAETFGMSFEGTGIVGIGMGPYADDEAYTEAVLRGYAEVVLAYLRGQGVLTSRRGLFGTTPVLTVPVEGGEWVFGRRSTRPPRNRR